MEKGDGYGGPIREPQHREVLYYIFPDNGSGLEQELGRAHSDEELAKLLAKLVREGNRVEDLLIYSLFDKLVVDVSVSVLLTFPNGGTLTGSTR